MFKEFYENPKFEESCNALLEFIPYDKKEEFSELLIEHNFLIAHHIDPITY